MAKRRLRAAERREQIARAALEIIAMKGARGLTVAEIARAVGTSDAALFRHFEDKAAIVGAAIDVFERTLMEDFPPQDPEPLERLRSFFVQRVRLCQKYPYIIRLAFDDRLLDAADPAGKRRVRKAVRASMTLIRTCVEEAQGRGQLPAVDPLVVVWMVIGVVRGAVSQTSKQRRDAEVLWNDLVLLLGV